MLLSSLLLCPTLLFNDLLLSALLCSQSLLCSSPTITVGGNSCLCTLLSCVALHGTGGGLNGRVMGGWGSARSPHSSPLRLRSLHLSTSEGGHQATSPHISTSWGSTFPPLRGGHLHLPTYLHLGDQPREPRDRETASEGHLPCIHILGATSPLLHLQDKLSTSPPLKGSCLSTSVKKKVKPSQMPTQGTSTKLSIS